MNVETNPDVAAVYFERSEHYVIHINLDNEIIAINDSACLLFQTTKNAIIGSTFTTTCEKNNVINPLPLDLTEITSGIFSFNQKIEFPNLKKHVSFKITYIQSKPETTGILLIGTDITELEKLRTAYINTEKQIKYQNEFFTSLDKEYSRSHPLDRQDESSFSENLFSYYEDIIALLPGIVYWKDLNGIYLGCNDEFVHMRNFESKRSIIGKTDYEVFSAEEADKLIINDRRVIKTGETLEIEEYVRNIEGAIDTYLSTKRPIRNSKNRIIGILGISTKITERKASEIKLAYEQKTFKQFYDNRLRKMAQISKQVTGQVIETELPEDHLLNIKDYLINIISCLPGLVFWKDRNGVYLGCNDGMIKWRGVTSKSDIIGKSDFEIFSEEEAITLRENDKLVMSTRKTMSIEETVVMANNQTITYLTNKVPLLDAKENAIGILGISLDITAKKKAEDALQIAKEQAETANKSKSEFLANISHDLRAPLHGILGMTDILSAKKHYTEQTEYIHTLKHAGQNLLALIEDILSYSELENKDEKLTLTSFNLTTLLNKSVSLFSHQAGDKNITFIHEKATNGPIFVKSYPQALQRIVDNLLDNALKFTKNGSITLTEQMVVKKGKDTNIAITISDTGIGIPDNKLETIFEKFSRVNPSYEGRYKGVGLGLTIVKQFVDKIGGTIQVKSKINVGTSFTLQLPHHACDKQMLEPEQKIQICDKDVAQLKSLNLNVLLIEDDQIGQKFASLVLNDLNCCTTLAKDGKEALRKIYDKYDVIFSDIGLPDTSGLEVAKTIRNTDNPNKATPLIAITGHAAEYDRQACENVGFNAVLRKPLSMNGFKRTLVEWFVK